MLVFDCTVSSRIAGEEHRQVSSLARRPYAPSSVPSADVESLMRLLPTAHALEVEACVAAAAARLEAKVGTAACSPAAAILAANCTLAHALFDPSHASQVLF